LSERHFVPARQRATSCDLLAAIERESDLPPHVRAIADQIQRSPHPDAPRRTKPHLDAPTAEVQFRRAVLAAYPDRVAKRREAHGDRLLLASGTGARLARERGVHDAEFLVAVDVAAGAGGGDPLVRLATRIERDWLTPTSREIVHRFDEAAGSVKASVVERYDALSLSEHACAPDPIEAERLVTEAYIRRGPDERDAQWLRRLEFAGAPMSFDTLVRATAAGATSLRDIDIAAHVSTEIRRRLDRDAPVMLTLPGGRHASIEYRDSGPFVAVKLQALFGLTETPRLGPRRAPITFEILAPNGRPVQVTSDLASFWSRGYPEVRKQLRGRYPKHAWPETPGLSGRRDRP
jgi:ATP-dependent helicase HrpB